MSGLESFIDYKAWALTYKPQDKQIKPQIEPESIDPAKIDRLSKMKPVDPSKQKEALEALDRIKGAMQKGASPVPEEGRVE